MRPTRSPRAFACSVAFAVLAALAVACATSDSSAPLNDLPPDAGLDAVFDAPPPPRDAADANTCPDRLFCHGVCVDPAVDNLNCGGCDKHCPAFAPCQQGVCTCPGPEGGAQSYCGGVCVDTSSDPNNCGGCGKLCFGQGGCQNGTCACGSGDTMCGVVCTDTSKDPLHCGGCANACGVGFTCVASQCVCPRGGTVCGGECVDTTTDTSNCGSCGNVCGSGPPNAFCNTSHCNVTLASGLPTWAIGGLLAGDANNLYFTTGDVNGLSQIPKTGGAITGLSFGDPITALTVDAANVYFGDRCGSIKKVPIGGGSVTVVSPPLTTNCNSVQVLWLYDMAVDATDIYWSQPNGGKIHRTPLAGGATTTFYAVPGGGYMYAVALDATNVYVSYYSFGQYTVAQVPKAGGSAVILATAPMTSFISDLAVDATNVYVCDEYGGVVSRVPKGGGNVVALATGQDQPAHIAVDSTSVYIANQGYQTNRGSVIKVPIGGGNATVINQPLTAQQAHPYGIVVDGSSVYFTTAQTLPSPPGVGVLVRIQPK